jgi:hypothetical protein
MKLKRRNLADADVQVIETDCDTIAKKTFCQRVLVLKSVASRLKAPSLEKPRPHPILNWFRVSTTVKVKKFHRGMW